MPEEAKGATTDGSPTVVTEATDKDEKGVPWKNRAQEFQRKYEETQKELEKVKSAPPETKALEAPNEDEQREKRKARLYDFVEDPDKYIEGRIAEREIKREMPAAEAWVRSQEGFAVEDEAHIMRIIREHGLNQNSPMLRAKSAWQILKAEKLEREFSQGKADKSREDRVSRTTPDSASRSAATRTGPKRAEIIAQLKQAADAGDSRKQADLLNQLEDVRE